MSYQFDSDQLAVISRVVRSIERVAEASSADGLMFDPSVVIRSETDEIVGRIEYVGEYAAFIPEAIE